MPEVIVQRVRDGWVNIGPDFVQIETIDEEEIVYWDYDEWNEPGNAEAAQAALNAICLALLEGCGAVRQRIGREETC